MSGRVVHAPVPEGAVELDTLVDRWEQDPRKREALARARQALGEVAYAKKPHSLAGIRMSKGLSQSQLAKLVGTTQPHLSRIEHGGEKIYLDTAKRLAVALGISLDELAAAIDVS